MAERHQAARGRPNISEQGGRPRLVWISRAGGVDGGTIYDLKLREALRPAFEIIHVESAAAAPKSAQLTSMIRHRLPHDRAGYKAPAVVNRARDACREAAAAVISHESLDWLAATLELPVTLVLHNVTSAYVGHITPAPWIGERLACAYRAYERSTYARRSHRTLVCLSAADRQSLSKLTSLPTFTAPPGMPPHTVLGMGAVVEPRLAISGTFDWLLKIRGLQAFARQYRQSGLRLAPVFDAPPPAFVRDLIPDWRQGPMSSPGTLSFGLVTDRFEAGFKLKVGAYIASNLVTLSFANVGQDYEGLPHAREFIRQIDSIEQMHSIMAAMSRAETPAVIERFRVFQAAAAARFTWDLSASVVTTAVRTALSPSDAESPRLNGPDSPGAATDVGDSPRAAQSPSLGVP